MTTESDRLLITRVRQNDQAAWAEIDKRYRGRLTAYVRRRLKDHASVEDVVQETFIGFANSLANYDDKRGLEPGPQCGTARAGGGGARARPPRAGSRTHVAGGVSKTDGAGAHVREGLA